MLHVVHAKVFQHDMPLPDHEPHRDWRRAARPVHSVGAAMLSDWASLLLTPDVRALGEAGDRLAAAIRKAGFTERTANRVRQ